MPSAKPSSSNMTNLPKSKKPHQLLISRFFGPKQTPPRSKGKTAKEKSPNPTCEKKIVKQNNISPSEQEANLTSVEQTVEKQSTIQVQVHTAPTPREMSPAHSPLLSKGDTPEKGTRSATRKRKRLFVIPDDDIDSEEDLDRPTKLKRNDQDPDPDFEGGSIELDDDDCHLTDEEDPDMEVMEYDEGGSPDIPSEQNGKQLNWKKKTPPGLTLMSYSRENAKDAHNLPRNPKTRKKFTQKIGKLENNSFFMRRTGGGGCEPDERSRGKNARRSAVKYTPLEKQYVALRHQNPAMLLVVECGYKFRLFDEDAATASKVLRVAAYFDHNFLTASFPTHRLPHHVARLVQAGYKVGVVSQNETAALKKAADKPSTLFQRSLTAVYTKGTLVADGKLSALSLGLGGKGVANAATYILAVFEIKSHPESHRQPSQPPHAPETRKIAIAAVDSATGDVLFDCFDDDVLRSDLESRLVALEPVEILLTADINSAETELVIKSHAHNTSARLERLGNSSFTPNKVLKQLNAIIEAKHAGSGKNVPPVLACLGALAEYLKQFGLQLSMSNAMEFESFASRRQMKLGADVLRNFEVFGNSNDGGIDGSLIGLLNRTKTSFGSREMRKWLTHPLVDPVDISERLDCVEYLSSIVDFVDSRMTEGKDSTMYEGDVLRKAVFDLVKSLSRLPDLEKGLTRISCRKCKPSEFLGVIQAFEGVGSKLDNLKQVGENGKLPVLLANMFEKTPNVRDVLKKSILKVLNRAAASDNRHHDLFNQDIPLDEPLPSSEYAEFLELVSELHAANDDVRKAAKVMDALLAKLKKTYSFPRWEWKKVAVEEYLLEVPPNRASLLPHSWPIISQTKTVKRFRPPEAARGYESMQCSRETRDAVSSKAWLAYLELFASVATQLRAVGRTLMNLDCLAALARVSNLPGYSKPSINCDRTVSAGLYAENARHPLTEALQTSQSYVPNDVRLGLDKHETAVVISGPNYGGKSSYTRMTALLVMLAQVGSYVPAESAVLSPFDSIYARMGSSDSIAKGMSSLMVELAETSRILRNAGSKSLVVLDELGRGTSTHDGTAIAYATLSHLVKVTKCVTMCVTHYPVLASLEKEMPSVVSAHYMDYHEEKGDVDMETKEDNNANPPKATKITFLYKLAKGVAASSYGLNVARLAGIPPAVIEQATERAISMEKQLDKQNAKNEFARVFSETRWQGDSDVEQVLDASRPIS